MIIRLHTSSGQSRIEVSTSDNIRSLKEKIYDKIKIPPDEQILFYDKSYTRQVEFADGDSVTRAKLKHGDTLHVVGSTDAVIDTSETCKLFSKKAVTNADLPPIPLDAKPVATEEAAARGDADGNSDVSKAPFKAFDQFLIEHDYNVSDLPLNLTYKSSQLQMGQINKFPKSLTLKHQRYRHVDHLEIMNVAEFENFVRYWSVDCDMQSPRVGVMYGYYVEDAHYEKGMRAICEAIYEPPQECEGGEVRLSQDPSCTLVREIAGALGLECIGWVFTHLPREEILTSTEIIQIIEKQFASIDDEIAHFTGYPVSTFITCCITLDSSNNNEPTPTAYMVSDLGMALYRDGVIGCNTNDLAHMRVRDAEKNEVMPLILESGKETKEFDNDWLIVRVNVSAPIVVQSLLKNYHFPRENRMRSIGPSDIPNYLNSAKIFSGGNETQNFNKFADFHFLLYISKLFDKSTTLSICSAIINKHAVDSSFEEILKTLN